MEAYGLNSTQLNSLVQQMTSLTIDGVGKLMANHAALGQKYSAMTKLCDDVNAKRHRAEIKCQELEAIIKKLEADLTISIKTK